MRRPLAHHGVGLALGLAVVGCSSPSPPEEPRPLEADLYTPVVPHWGKVVDLASNSALFMHHDSGAWSVWGHAYNATAGLLTLPLLVTPTRSPGLAGLDAISVNFEYGCGFNEKEVRCWGSNSYGEVGQPAGGARVPTPVDLPLPAVSIVAGASLTLAVLTDGSVWHWGYYEGQPEASWPVPVKQKGLAPIRRALAASWVLTCVVDENEKAWCWGVDAYLDWGEELVHVPEHEYDVPVRVPELDGVKRIWFSGGNTILHRVDGSLAGWGLNYSGMLGTGDKEPREDYVPIDMGVPVIRAAVGGRHVCALVEGGTVFCCGEGQYGQLAQGEDKTTHASPVLVQGLPPIVTLTATADATFALDASGGVWCWGAVWECTDSDGAIQRIELPSVLRATSNQDP